MDHIQSMKKFKPRRWLCEDVHTFCGLTRNPPAVFMYQFPCQKFNSVGFISSGEVDQFMINSSVSKLTRATHGTGWESVLPEIHPERTRAVCLGRSNTGTGRIRFPSPKTLTGLGYLSHPVLTRQTSLVPREFLPSCPTLTGNANPVP